MGCGYKPWGAHQLHCGKGSSMEAWEGKPGKGSLSTGQADTQGLENIYPFSSHHFTFRGGISRVLAHHHQSFPSSSSPSALPRPSLYSQSLYKSNAYGDLRELEAYFCRLPVMSMSNRWHSSTMRVPPIPQTHSLSLDETTAHPYSCPFEAQQTRAEGLLLSCNIVSALTSSNYRCRNSCVPCSFFFHGWA